MARHVRRGALLLVLGLGLGLMAGPATASGPYTETAAPLLTPQAYQALMQREVLGPFTAFGKALNKISSAQQAIAAGPGLKRQLRRLTIGLNRVAARHAAHPTLEKQRRRIVAAGRAALPALQRFVNAVAKADRAALQAALPGVLTAMTRFAKSAKV